MCEQNHIAYKDFHMKFCYSLSLISAVTDLDTLWLSTTLTKLAELPVETEQQLKHLQSNLYQK